MFLLPMRDGSPPGTRIPLHESLVLAVILFGFWLILSGKFDVFHMATGALLSLAIALASCRLYARNPPIVREGRHPFAAAPWWRLLGYLPWLAGQIFVSSVQVARIVLSPRLRLGARLLSFIEPLPHGMARTTLANSITLTPGTVTIDLRGDAYLVHALTEEAAKSLEGDELGGIRERVRGVFGSRSR